MSPAITMEQAMPGRKSGERDTREQNEVNPAERDDDGNAEESVVPDGDTSRAAAHNRQSEQNQDQNQKFDPSNGRRPDQRRNDKRG